VQHQSAPADPTVPSDEDGQSIASPIRLARVRFSKIAVGEAQDHARVFADFDPELPGIPLVVPPSVLRPSEKHCELVEQRLMFCICSKYHADVLAATVEMRSMAAAQGDGFPAGLC
jgi:hypothetical protein